MDCLFYLTIAQYAYINLKKQLAQKVWRVTDIFFKSYKMFNVTHSNRYLNIRLKNNRQLKKAEHFVWHTFMCQWITFFSVFAKLIYLTLGEQAVHI